MSEIVLHPEPQSFPVGTVARVFELRPGGSAPVSGEPKGTVVAEAAVDAKGALTLTGLSAGTGYVAWALVGGLDRYVSFRLPGAGGDAFLGLDGTVGGEGGSPLSPSVVSGSEKGATSVQLTGNQEVGGEKKFTGAQTVTANFAAQSYATFGATTQDPRIPFKSSQGVFSSQAGLSDHVAHLFQAIVTGEFSETEGSDPNRVWSFDVYGTTGTKVGDGNGLVAYVNLLETSIRAPAGTAMTSIGGLVGQVDFYGVSAGATATNAYSLRAVNPSRQAGATSGTATNSYGLLVDKHVASDVGATNAYSVKVSGGYSEFNGTVKVIAETASQTPFTLKMASTPTVDAFRLNNALEETLFKITKEGGIGGQNSFTAFQGVSRQVSIGGAGVGTLAGISFGSAADTIFTRVAAGVLCFGAASVTAPTMTGHGLMFGNVTTAPSTNPVGGPILYAEAGALKCRGTSGTVTTLAPA